MTKSRFGAILLLVGTFVLGGLLGGTLTSWGERRTHERSRRDRPRPSYIERLSQDLNLTQPQRESIQVILDRHQPKMDSIWGEIRQKFPLLEAERLAVRQEVIGVLTAEQQTRYNAIVQRQDSIRKTNDRERNRNAPPKP
jgi:hypothetical protein